MDDEGRDVRVDRVRAGDIRVPQTLDEADAALAICDARLESIATRMRAPDVGDGERARAESARRLWQAKRMEVAYAGARLRAQGMAPAQDPALAALVARVERVEAAIALREVSRG